ncbi:hypothetical protein [Chondromyces apiculatus]|nr:hypothetical protein [Chondromyces apiculatus]
MKSWVIAAIFVSMGALAACDSGDGSDGAGGSGGDTGEGGSTSSSTDTDTGTDTGTGTGTAVACAEEDAMATECSQDSVCGTCAIAEDGPCRAEFVACAGDAACAGLATCLNACAANDTTCEDDCYTAAGGDDSASAGLYFDAQACVICTACPVSCQADMEPNCMP